MKKLLAIFFLSLILFTVVYSNRSKRDLVMEVTNSIENSSYSPKSNPSFTPETPRPTKSVKASEASTLEAPPLPPKLDWVKVENKKLRVTKWANGSGQDLYFDAEVWKAYEHFAEYEPWPATNWAKDYIVEILINRGWSTSVIKDQVELTATIADGPSGSVFGMIGTKEGQIRFVEIENEISGYDNYLCPCESTIEVRISSIILYSDIAK